MIEIGLNKISKNYGFEQVLKDISFEMACSVIKNLLSKNY